METMYSPSVDDESAADYDVQREMYGWYGPEALFGLMFEYIHPGETLLALGIGTGLGASLFYKAGLRVWGLDWSGEMLKASARKGFAVELVQRDLRDMPLPYGAGFFNHIIAAGVLNFLGDLEPILMEAARVMKAGGVLGFTVEDRKADQSEAYIMGQAEIVEESEREAGFRMYRHGREYVCALLGQGGFAPLREFEFLASKSPQGSELPGMFGKAYVARKVGIEP